MNLSEDGIWLHVLSSGIVILFVLINFIGASAVGKSELLIVAVKVLVLLGFGIMGFTTMQAREFSLVQKFDFGDLLLASGVVFMSYEGFGLVANTAEDVKRPYRNLPRALFLSVIIVMLIYALVTIAVIGNMSIQSIIDAKEYALAEAARPIMGSLGFTIMGIAALFSTASAINATIYGPVYMLQETAKAEQIPGFFTRNLFGHRSGISLLITGSVIVAIANLLDLEAIAETGSMIFLVIYTAVNVANYKLRKKTNSKVWLILLAIFGTGFSFAMLVYYQSLEKSISIYILLAIFLFAFVYQWINQYIRSRKS